MCIYHFDIPKVRGSGHAMFSTLLDRHNHVTINGDHIWSPFIVPGTTIMVVPMVVPLSKFTIERWSPKMV